MSAAPILIVDDDRDDRQLLQDAWKELKYDNPLTFLDDGAEVLQYLDSDSPLPFIILCDINIPKMNGFELRQKLIDDQSMKYKSIPFIFWSGIASKEQIQKAYDLSVHGFFVKENSFDKIRQSLINIVEYRLASVTPKDV